MMPTLEIKWPDSPGGQTLQTFEFAAGEVTPIHFKTGPAIGNKQGSITLETPVPWLWGYALNNVAGDMDTNIAVGKEPPTVGGSSQPRIEWRGVPNQGPKTAQLPQFFPDTDYYFNVQPDEGGAASFQARIQLDAGRQE